VILPISYLNPDAAGYIFDVAFSLMTTRKK